MNRPVLDQRSEMAQHLEEVQRGVEDCRAGLTFLGYVFKRCDGMDLGERSAKGLGHILHSLVADIEGIEGDFDTLEQFFKGQAGEQVIDLDHMGGRGQGRA